MRSFNDKSNYLLFSGIYVMNAIVLWHKHLSPNQLVGSVPFYVAASQFLGALILLLICGIAYGKTSYVIEKTIIVLTGIVALLFGITVSFELKIVASQLPYRGVIALWVSTAAGFLTMVRLVQVLQTRKSAGLD